MSYLFIGLLLILGIPIALGVLIGWLAWGRNRPGGMTGGQGNVSPQAWLASELQSDAMRQILTDEQAERIRTAYRLPWLPPQSPSVESVAAPSPAETVVSVAPDTPNFDWTAHEPSAPESESDTPSQLIPSVAAVDTNTPATPNATEPPPRSPLAAPVEPFAPQRRDPLDPATLMLYLGAFLVVAAGIVYASYNWSDLVAWQKLGLLAAVTLAFGATGWFLLGNQRVSKAAETFIAISALLVPANAVAAWSVFDRGNASIPVITLLGSLVTTITYTVFSIRPGDRAYAYGASISALVAIGAILPAAGLHWGWSGPATLIGVSAIVELRYKLPRTVQHLERPLLHAGIVVIPIATAVGVIATFATTDWIIPATLAAATVALGALAHRERHPVWGVLGSLTGIGAVAATVAVLDPSPIWVNPIAALLVGTGLVALAESGPGWFRNRYTRLALHIEATAAWFVAVSLITDTNASPALTTAIFVLSTLLSILVPAARQSRGWLLATAALATGTWLAMAGMFDISNANGNLAQVYITVLPLLMATAAFVLDRWSERTSRAQWGEPIWIAAAIIAVLHTIVVLTVAIAGDDTISERLMVTTFVIYGFTSLVAAWSTARSIIRSLYAPWLLLAILTLAAFLDLRPEDSTSFTTLSLVVILGVTWKALRHTETAPLAWFGPRASAGRRIELPILAGFLGPLLVGMVAVTLRYIVSVGDNAPDDLPGIVWTWFVYLAVLVLATVATVALGWNLPAPNGSSGPARSRFPALIRGLPALSLVFGAVSITLLLRMVTTDVVTWTWAGFGVAALLFALPIMPLAADSPQWFARQLVHDSPLFATIMLVASGAANLDLTYTSDNQTHAGITAAVALVTAVTVLAASLRSSWTPTTWLAFGTSSLAIIQATRAVSDNDRLIMIALAGFAWVVMGAAVALPRRKPWLSRHRDWTNAALGIGTLAVLAPGTDLVSFGGRDADVQYLVLAMVSLAGLLAVDAVRRKDRMRGIVASAIAVAALLVQISIDSPENVLPYTIPLGLYLLALGVIERRVAKTRDLLLAAGSGVLLIPALLLAQAEGTLGYLWLAGGMALGLFVAGVLLRLRVLIAAGVIGVTIIVFRMLLEAVLALESWITLLAAGLLLLGGGTASLVWKEALLRRLEHLQHGWTEME